MRPVILLSLLLTAPACAAPARRPAAAPATVLVGQSWLGLWRGGRVTVSRALPGWTLGAARLRGGRVEVAAHRDVAAASGDAVLRFDAATLAPLGQGHDAALAQATVRAPIGTDPDTPDDAAALPRPLTQQRGAGRVVLSPDGSTAALFDSSGHGRVFTAAGRPLTGTPLSIDDGSARDNGAARAVACLLPRGEGVIYTLVGQPADRVSEFQRFGSAAPPVTLRTPYVMSCLAPR